jgi:hypothetical protein
MAVDGIEQAKGVLAATRGVGPDQAFQQLRQQARSSSRKLADLAQEVVQAANASGSPPRRPMTPGSGRPRRGPGRPSRRCRRPRPGWPDAPRRWTGPRTTQTHGSGPLTSATTSPTNATGPPTNATGPPAIPSSAVGGTKRQQGTSEAAP